MSGDAESAAGFDVEWLRPHILCPAQMTSDVPWDFFSFIICELFIFYFYWNKLARLFDFDFDSSFALFFYHVL